MEQRQGVRNKRNLSSRQAKVMVNSSKKFATIQQIPGCSLYRYPLHFLLGLAEYLLLLYLFKFSIHDFFEFRQDEDRQADTQWNQPMAQLQRG